MSSVCTSCGKELQSAPGNSTRALLCTDCERQAASAVTIKPQHPVVSSEGPAKEKLDKSGPGKSGIAHAISEGPSIGAYVMLEEIGRGGMGRVYKAMHSTLRQVRALKVLNKDESRNSRVVARFQREARIVAKLDHPHVVKIYEFEKDSER